MVSIFTAGMPNPPASMDTLSLAVPQGWAIQGIQKAMAGAPAVDILPYAGVLFVWGVVFFGLGVLRFRRRFA
jgi:ABC-type multidrug transport system permease subunit